MAPSGWGNSQLVGHSIIFHRNYSDFIKDDNVYFMITLVSPIDFEIDFPTPQEVTCIWWSLVYTFAILTVVILFLIAEKFDISVKYFVLLFFILLSTVGVFVVGSFWRSILWSAITTVVGCGSLFLTLKIEETLKLDPQITEMIFYIALALLFGSNALAAVLLSDIS